MEDLTTAATSPKVLDSFCYIYQPVLKPRGVLFIFLLKRTGLLSLFAQKRKKSAR